MGVQGGHQAIDLIFKLNKRSGGSDVRWKAIPQQCPTVAETALSSNYSIFFWIQFFLLFDQKAVFIIDINYSFLLLIINNYLQQIAKQTFNVVSTAVLCWSVGCGLG